MVKTARARTLIKQALKSPATPVKGIRRSRAGHFSITDMSAPDLLWSTCCLAVPKTPIVGRISEDGHWIVHRTECPKTEKGQWEKGQWAVQEREETLHITFTVHHRTGALLSVLELIAQHDINGHAIQGKGRSSDAYVINVELGGKSPRMLGVFLLQLKHVDSVREILNYTWKP